MSSKIRTLAQKAGLPTDDKVEKKIQKVLSTPIVLDKAKPAPKPIPKPEPKVRKVRKVLMDEEGNIVKVERKKRELSEEQKEALRERLAKARQVKHERSMGVIDG